MHYLVPPDHFRKNVRAEMKTLLCYDISRDGLCGDVLLCYKIDPDSHETTLRDSRGMTKILASTRFV